ncbi:MAG: M10 family metallopeptidase C-terminal domain-containing protein, partial [Rhizobiaceae bacterium]|nr:Ig-like domain-containing protein [Hyphomicrobiales bacterium]NRB32101.1 M10 family metallopeptidase C-terminal domain-containing protein [Rhizobiaceae bacterium]
FNGEDSFTYEVLDGNGGSDTGTATITVTPVPEAPVVSGLSVDTGASDSDGVTFDSTPTITWTADDGDTVEVFRDNVSIGSVTANGGVWSIGDASFLADGDYVYTAIATDGFGTQSATSAPFNVTVDTTAPAAPVVSVISDDTGILADDEITSDTSLTVSGTAEADSTVEVFRDGVSIGTAVATGGQWSLADNSSLADGNYAYTAIATDVAGLSSAASAPLNVEVDTAKPDAPVVDAIADDDATPGDGITSDTTLTISGTAEADSTVEVFRDGVSIGTTVATGGVWSLADPMTLDVDKYVYTATATDTAGNVSNLSGDFDVHVIGPLFSDGFDGVNFDNVVAGKYIAGTQYDSLGGQSEIRFASSQAEATEAGFDLAQAFNGGDDVDTYFSGFGQEIINGNGGNDRFVMIDGFAFDVINGGANDQSNVNDGDTLDLTQYSNGVTVNLTNGTYSDSVANTSGTLTGIETVLGTEASDAITGSGLGDLLVGNGGADTINGAGGNDLIFGDRFRTSEDDYSDDILNGNGGNDSIYGDAGSDMTSGVGGNDIITGAGGRDSLVGDTAGDLSATGGNDTLNGNGGADSLFGDTVGTLKGNGQGGDDILIGGNQGDVLVGDARLMEGATAAGGNDELTGNGGNDTLYGDVFYSLTDGVASSTDNGNGGDDDLDGGTGNDTLIGQSGNDVLTGGTGADTFVFSTGFDEDTIVDFVKGTDKVDVTGFGLTQIELQDIIDAGADVAGDLVLNFLNGDLLTMTGQANQAIDTDDFDF